MNLAILCGRTTRDPEIRTTNDGKTVARFSLAVDGYKDKVDFLNCVAFGKTAEFVEKYVTKGQKYLVDGSISTGSYEKDGHKVYTTDILVNHIEFASSKTTQAELPSSGDNNDWMDAGDMEALPFN